MTIEIPSTPYLVSNASIAEQQGGYDIRPCSPITHRRTTRTRKR